MTAALHPPQGLVDAIRSAPCIRDLNDDQHPCEWADKEPVWHPECAAQAAHQWMLQAAEPLRAMAAAAREHHDDPSNNALKWDYRVATNPSAIADLAAALGLNVGEAG